MSEPMTLLELLSDCAIHFATHYADPAFDEYGPRLRAAAARLREAFDESQRDAGLLWQGYHVKDLLTRINNGAVSPPPATGTDEPTPGSPMAIARAESIARYVGGTSPPATCETCGGREEVDKSDIDREPEIIPCPTCGTCGGEQIVYGACDAANCPRKIPHLATKPCPSCAPPPVTCGTCGGTKVWQYDYPDNTPSLVQPCPTCCAPPVTEKRCETCDGSGLTMSSRYSPAKTCWNCKGTGTPPTPAKDPR